MIELFPAGFEERELACGDIEVAAYAPPGDEERFWAAFGPGRADDVEPGWADGWRRFHRAIRVGPLWVGPPWLDPDADAVAVVIDPGRAFGTGAHPTTAICLELLLACRRGSLVDAGCGSGVLAIAAAKVGFAPVVAVDVDDVAVDVTRENARANGVDVAAASLDVLRAPFPAADVVVANITLATVEAVAACADARLLVTSGYLAAERPAVEAWRHVDRRERGGWAGDLFERA